MNVVPSLTVRNHNLGEGAHPIPIRPANALILQFSVLHKVRVWLATADYQLQHSN
jgi:hypothetical protein